MVTDESWFKPLLNRKSRDYSEPALLPRPNMRPCPVLKRLLVFVTPSHFGRKPCRNLRAIPGRCNPSLRLPRSLFRFHI
jgi:hypothetical protein